MSFNNGGRGGRPIDPELQAQLDEAKALSASFTRAGDKSRPGQGRGGGRPIFGGGRSTPFQTVPARASVSHGARTSPFQSVPTGQPTASMNTGPGNSSARFGTTGVGAGTRATINPPVFKNASPPKPRSPIYVDGGSIPIKGRGRSTFGDTSYTPGTKSPYPVGPSNSQVPRNTSGGFMAQTVNVTAISAPTPMVSPIRTNISSAMFGMSTGPVSTGQVSQNHLQASPGILTAGRELIVTNWTEDVEKKPFIPAHLEQKSAFRAIQEIADLIDRPVEAITRDGFSIPLPRDGARPLLAPFHQPAAHVPRQPDVDPTGWFMAASNIGNTFTNPPNSGGQINPHENARSVSYGAMDIEMSEDNAGNTQFSNGGSDWAALPHGSRTASVPVPSVATNRPVDLSGSIWAEASWKPALKENQRSPGNIFGSGPKKSSSGIQATSGPSSSFGGNSGVQSGAGPVPAFGHNSGRGSGVTPRAAAGGLPAPAPKQEKKTKTLADSIWA